MSTHTVAGHVIDTDDPTTWAPVTTADIAAAVEAAGGRANPKRSKADNVARLAFYSDYPTATSIDDVIAGLSDDPAKARIEFQRAWKDEHRAHRTDPSVPTPIDDAVAAAGSVDAVLGAKARGTSAAVPKVEQVVRFVRRGKAMPDSQNKMSSLAFQATVGCGGDGLRWTADELRAWLATQGIASPTTTTWAVTLPNDVEIAAVSLHPKNPAPAATASAAA